MGHRFDPWSRKIPQAVEQLSPCATTTDSVPRSPGATATEVQVLQSPCSIARDTTEWEAHTAKLERNYSLQLEKSPHSNKDPAQPKYTAILKHIHTHTHTHIYTYTHICVYSVSNCHCFKLDNVSIPERKVTVIQMRC